MRIPHCTVALAVFLLAAAPGRAQGPSEATFTVFFRGIAIGAEEVAVRQSAEGMAISGTERIGPPFNAITRQATIDYSAQGHPRELVLEGSLRDQLVQLHTTVTGTTAATEFTQGSASGRKSHEIAVDAVLLPSMFFGAYEALATRLAGAKTGDEVAAYVPPRAVVRVAVKGVSEDRVRTQSGLLSVRRYSLEIVGPDGSAVVELWATASGRMLRLQVTAQSFDIIRQDIASVYARLEPVSRPNDERVQVPAYGFSLAGTVSKPSAKAPGEVRHPAVVLVGGSDPTDRDEMVAGVPVLGQVAAALADAGFLVLRYDKRGIGQSGGRADTASLDDYAEDALAAVKYLEGRKDVIDRRIALVGYGEGGTVAATAAARSDHPAALVLLASPGMSGAKSVLERQRHELDRLNVPEPERRAKVALQQKIIQAVLSGKGLEGLPDDVRRQADTAWFQSFLAFTPAKVLKKIDQPILFVHGEMDTEIDPSNADRFAELARARSGRKGQNVAVVKVPGVNHLLVPAKTGAVDEYLSLPDKTVSHEVVTAISSWLKKAMRAR
jgi:uncharacterized protein